MVGRGPPYGVTHAANCTVSRRCKFHLDFSASLNGDTGNDSPAIRDRNVTVMPYAWRRASAHVCGGPRRGAPRSSPVLWFRSVTLRGSSPSAFPWVTSIEDSRMSRRNRSRKTASSSTRFRAPRETRVVSSTPSKSSASPRRRSRKRVPQIRLSGAWLERIGFAPGVEYLVLADVPNQILLALVDV
jgi:hypothetical protein